MIAGGLAFAAGVRPRLAAAMLAGTLVPATLVQHTFWKLQDPEERTAQRVQFYKNLAIFGGAILVAAGPNVG